MLCRQGGKHLDISIKSGDSLALDDDGLTDLACYIAKELVRKQKHPADWLVLRPQPPVPRISKKHTAKIKYCGKQPIPLSEAEN